MSVWNLICKALGHRFRRAYELDQPAPKGWWFEYHRCTRCGGVTRQLVASQEG